MELRTAVVIGASAGGLGPLQTMVEGIEPSQSAAYFAVLHTTPNRRSNLASILGRAGRVKVLEARDGMPMEGAVMYVAAPDHHMYIEDGRVRSVRGPRENRHRPSVNVLFRSAAQLFGERAIGVVLSGSLEDGTGGLWEIERRGGTTIVQDPAEAMFPYMPRAALQNIIINYVLPAAKIPSVVNALVAETEVKRTSEQEAAMDEFTNLTCPECRGPLRRLQLGRFQELECRVGHRYSPESALMAYDETQERALWAAVVALEEGADLAARLADTHPEQAEQLRLRAERRRSQAGIIREIVQKWNVPDSTSSV